MRPLSDTRPKPLLKVGGKPLIEWHIKRLSRAGINHVVINHAWLGDQIEAALGDGRRYGVDIVYSSETTPLETAGGIAQALPLLGNEPFLVINGDIWCDWDPSLALPIAQNLDAANQLAWLLLVDNPPHHPEGDFSLDADGRLIDPKPGEALTFAGIGVYHPSLFKSVKADSPAPLAPVLYQALDRGHVRGAHYTGIWMDVGTPQRLAQLNALLAETPVQPL